MIGRDGNFQQSFNSKMDNEKFKKRIRTIGIILIALGGLMLLSNLPAYFLLNFTESGKNILSEDVIFVSPIFFVLNGILLITSGILLRSLRKVGLILSIICSITTSTLIAIHSYFFIKNMTIELSNIQMIGSIIFVLLFVIPSGIMMFFLSKKQSRNNFQ